MIKILFSNIANGEQMIKIPKLIYRSAWEPKYQLLIGMASLLDALIMLLSWGRYSSTYSCSAMGYVFRHGKENNVQS